MAFAGTTAEDLFALYKTQKFVVVDSALGFGSATVVLADLAFWNKNFDNLTQWINNCTPTAQQRGMTIDFASRQDLLLFKLKWT
jgi:hypothetical protein